MTVETRQGFRKNQGVRTGRMTNDRKKAQERVKNKETPHTRVSPQVFLQGCLLVHGL